MHGALQCTQVELDRFPSDTSASGAYRDICSGYAHVLNVRFRDAPEEANRLAARLATLLSKSSDGDSDEVNATRQAMLARSLQFLTHPDLCRAALPAIVATIPDSGDAIRALGDLIVTYPRYLTEEEGREAMHPALVAALISAGTSGEMCNHVMGMMIPYGSLANLPELCELASNNLRIAPLAIVAMVNARCPGAAEALAALTAERPFLGTPPPAAAERLEAAHANVERMTTLWRENRHNAAPEAVEQALTSFARIRRLLHQESDFEFAQAIAARDLRLLSSLRSTEVEQIRLAAASIGAADRTGDFPSWRWDDRHMVGALIDAFTSVPERIDPEHRSAVQRALIDALLRLATLDSIEYVRSLREREPATSELGEHLHSERARLEYPKSRLIREG